MASVPRVGRVGRTVANGTTFQVGSAEFGVRSRTGGPPRCAGRGPSNHLFTDSSSHIVVLAVFTILNTLTFQHPRSLAAASPSAETVNINGYSLS